MADCNLIFRCFASGSSGNCYFLGTHYGGILIDAGISMRTIQKHLREMQMDFNNIHGILVTHDHADHIRAVGAIGERFHVPVFSTERIHTGIDRNYGVKEKLKTSRRYFTLGQEWELSGMHINTFPISHDSMECVGYVIDYLGQRFMIATDCGEPNQQLESALRTANHVVIEANHDEHLLLNGPYPIYLKERILSPKGHQSNETCGTLLKNNYHEGLRNIWLCHLSQENNQPQLAYDTVSNYLAEIHVVAGEDVFLTPLQRTYASPVYKLGDEMIKEKPIIQQFVPGKQR